MRKKQLEAKLNELREQVERSAVMREISDFQRQLRDEQTSGHWVSLDAAATKRNRDWSAVKDNLEEVFAAWCVNPLAKSYVDYQRYFVIGKGTQVKVPDEEGEDAGERVKNFLKLNEWEMLEKKMCEELSRDGELFVRFHGKNKFGFETDVHLISLIDPLEITAIDAPDPLKPDRYRRQYEKVGPMNDDGSCDKQTVTEWIDASEIIHVKVNTSHNELRGRSDLLVVLPWLRKLKAWIDDMARRNFWINAFVWDVVVKGNIQPSDVSPNAPMPGSVITHSEDEMWTPNAPQMHWADTSAGARAIKLLVMAGYKLPESWFGDTGESNLATTRALTLPSMRAFIDRQDYLKFYFEQIIKKGAGVENVNISFPEIAPEEAKDKASALKLLSEALTNITAGGLMSDETAYGLIQQFADGLDNWSDDESGVVGEKTRIQKEEAEGAEAAAIGRKIAAPQVERGVGEPEINPENV